MTTTNTTKHVGSLDRSVAFTILLDVLPGFAESVDDGGATVTRFLADWYQDPSTDMYAYGKAWAVRESLTDDERFFYDEAASGHDPSTETAEQGRARGARQLAAAEAWARGVLAFGWENDWTTWHVGEYPDAYDEEPATCELAWARPVGGGPVLASLGCVDDATPAYRRVVEAELALEAMPAVGGVKLS